MQFLLLPGNVLLQICTLATLLYFVLIERKPKITFKIHFQIHCNMGRFYSRKWHQPEHVAFCLMAAVVAKKPVV